MIIPLRLPGHLNMLFIKVETREIIRFEPHGSKYRGDDTGIKESRTNKFLETLTNQINTFFLTNGIDVLDEMKHYDLFENINVIPNFLNNIVGTIGTLSIGLFSVVFITFFLMRDTQIMENSIYVFTDKKSEKKLRISLDKIKHLLSRYFIGLVLQITILFILYSIILMIFGIENSIVIAFLCALLNLIPYIGPMIGCFLMLFLASRIVKKTLIISCLLQISLPPWTKVFLTL